MKKRIFSVGAVSDVGNVKEVNQDSILVEIGENSYGDFGLFVVADGLGGLKAGDTASAICINGFKKWWHEALPKILNDHDSAPERADATLTQLIRDINSEIMRYGNSIGERTGTTVSSLLIYNNVYMIKHVGDSRIYRINKRMAQLTEDHSWVASQVKAGAMSCEEARRHPRKNVLTQCLGVSSDIEIFQTWGESGMDDAFLLCSDGFYNLLEEYEIVGSLEKYKENEEDIQRVARNLLERVKERGERDNISAIFVCQRYDKEWEEHTAEL